MMQNGYKPYFDPDFESLIERIHPPRVCIDNDTCQDCTLIKVDSANKHGILLEMVQVLTDLDLIISKSYISSDGGWLMDVFHVTDRLGNKLTDENLIHYIQQALCAGRRAKANPRPVGATHIPTDEQLTILEMTSEDRLGLLSEISAVLVELGCHVVSAAAWTHNGRAASIIYVEDDSTGGGPITDPVRLANVEERLEIVLGAHHRMGEKRRVCLIGPVAGRTHMERRLHQLMYEDRDYERSGSNEREQEDERKQSSRIKKGSSRRCCRGIQVEIDTCNEKGYSVVNITSKDRPKLLFDTVCTLTDMQYVVFHAAISSKGSLATQEYYTRHKDGCTMDTEGERQRVIQCLVAAVERRVSHGLRLEVRTRNRVGLLSDITRVFRENALSISMAEIGTRGERAIGSFYVTDASGHDVDSKIVELVKQEIGGTAVVVNKSPVWVPHRSSSGSNTYNNSVDQGSARSSSLGSLLWAHLERISSSFAIKS